MINVDFQGTDKTVPATLRAKYPAVLQAVVVKMNALTLRLQQKIQGEKLQGQVLQHRTGKGAASVRHVPATETGDKVEGGVEAGGGPAYYMRFQNYGTDRAYPILPVNKKALAFFGAAGPVPINQQLAHKTQLGFRSKSASVRSGAFKQFQSLGGVVVKGVIHPPIQKRNFMESSAEEFKPEMTSGLAQAVIQGLNK